MGCSHTAVPGAPSTPHLTAACYVLAALGHTKPEMQCRVLFDARSALCILIFGWLRAVRDIAAGRRSNALTTDRCSAQLLHYNRIKSLPTTIGPA